MGNPPPKKKNTPKERNTLPRVRQRPSRSDPQSMKLVKALCMHYLIIEKNTAVTPSLIFQMSIGKQELKNKKYIKDFSLGQLVRNLLTVQLQHPRFPGSSWELEPHTQCKASTYFPNLQATSELLTSHSLGLLNSFFSVDLRNSSRLTSRSLFASTF